MPKGLNQKFAKIMVKISFLLFLLLLSDGLGSKLCDSFMIVFAQNNSIYTEQYTPHHFHTISKSHKVLQTHHSRTTVRISKLMPRFGNPSIWNSETNVNAEDLNANAEDT